MLAVQIRLFRGPDRRFAACPALPRPVVSLRARTSLLFPHTPFASLSCNACQIVPQVSYARYSGIGMPKANNKRFEQAEQLEVELNKDAADEEHFEPELEADKEPSGARA